MVAKRIVAVSTDPDTQRCIGRACNELLVADDLSEGLDIIGTACPDLVVLGGKHTPTDVRALVEGIAQRGLNIPVAVAHHENPNAASDTYIAAGAWNCLPGAVLAEYLQSARKDPPAPMLSQPILDGISPHIHDSDKQYYVDACAAVVNMVGVSESMIDTVRLITLVAESRCDPILIVGETGTGKELAARAVHHLRHPAAPFVAINCAALTASLLESELFGHVKGSFTGADRDKTGLLELAGDGSVFLDEISEMPLDLQAKLLRVLQERVFRKVGGVEGIACRATIMASSNRNLLQESLENRFRRDLYYRLSVCPITMPSLSDPTRRRDIGLLAEYFLRTSTIHPGKSSRIKCLTRLAVEALERHSWPGNVRELRNVIERAILHETTDKIGLSSIEGHLAEYAALSADGPGLPIRDFSLAKAERELIGRALQQTEGQKSRAAALLGISRATLYDKLRLYGLGQYKGGGPAGQSNADPLDAAERIGASA
ncbi:MAG TPA: sigma-54-dependent Fis family transcriptional regulator [Phycisphaerales bacterium]|nr:sigma-54-dependent Fis family transcriptional regulator [Phycisphaerales bacterium]